MSFLRKCTLVIRSADGVYDYLHSNPASPHRKRHEIKIGFLGLFLLSYYGLTLRITSTVVVDRNNAPLQIGFWHHIVGKFLDSVTPDNPLQGYQVQIILRVSQISVHYLKALQVLLKKVLSIFNPQRSIIPILLFACSLNFIKKLPKHLQA